VNALDIDLIVIGGGIGDTGNLIIKPAIEVMRKNLLVRKDDVRVEKARLGNIAGLIGAAELFS
jgi:glucokinase